ncbi:GntR family transcriptional regulator [Nocardiopsis ansamitocini]|uniref:Transcriptional regulator n=1 Tax=Nocardiopsis ansamitocini TaxID=1670832 RepID=A0A9W6UHP3_9ACTN|nr:GntR family transcriptional regulator [Nocardiopsis ansamitocini]GLU49081.1 transcriptional regulator [Nocardiopsis ansamitocini]
MPSTPLPKGLLAKQVRHPAPLRESVHEALLELITQRGLPPGRHLVESELASMLGVSRQPVREALQRLANEGWVDLRPGYGAFVHQPTESEAEQLLAVRGLLETESARLAARSATAEGLERLRAVYRSGVAVLEGGGGPQELVEANAELHRCVTELSGNTVLAELTGQVARRVRWYHALVAVQRGSGAWDEHAAIIAAIAEGREDDAGRLMREHTETTRLAYHARAAQDGSSRV